MPVPEHLLISELLVREILRALIEADKYELAERIKDDVKRLNPNL